jgi:hypothetical protein
LPSEYSSFPKILKPAAEVKQKRSPAGAEDRLMFEIKLVVHLGKHTIKPLSGACGLRCSQGVIVAEARASVKADSSLALKSAGATQYSRPGDEVKLLAFLIDRDMLFARTNTGGP